jgi:signal peptidase I
MRLRRIATWTTSLTLGLVVLATCSYAALLARGYRPVAVYSGSMVPELPVGSLAADRVVPASSVHVGDVITFADPYVAGKLVTHRVVAVIRTPRGLAYRTRGDANPRRDPWTIRLPERVGRVSFDVPWAGYALAYAKAREVRIALILLTSFTLLGRLLALIWRSPDLGRTRGA